MIQRAFSSEPPKITFTKDRKQYVYGDLAPGREVTLWYDAERLPNERSELNGVVAWTIQAFYRFSDSGEIFHLDMWSEGGRIRTKYDNVAGQGTMLTCRLVIPADAVELIVWFRNSGASGAEYWDSNLGSNFRFRFTSLDIGIESAQVLQDGKAPLAWFKVQVSAVPEVTGVKVLYWISNAPGAARADRELQLASSQERDADGRITWSSPTGAAVPVNAVIDYAVTYSVAGEWYKDSNSGKGYLAWGEKQELNLARKV